MKKTVKFFSLVIIMVLFSCSSEPIIESETSLQWVAGKAEVKKTTTDVYEKSDDPLVEFLKVTGASSTLHRNKNGITVNFKTKGLIPGNAYTLWFVVFGNEPGPPSSTHAAGHIVGGSGNGNFSGHLSVGDVFDTPSPNGKLPVFMTPLTAEVHIALRTHGPAQPGMMPEQINTINGGCGLPDIGFPSGPTLHEDSDIEGYCANIQVAIHQN